MNNYSTMGSLETAYCACTGSPPERTGDTHAWEKVQGDETPRGDVPGKFTKESKETWMNKRSRKT